MHLAIVSQNEIHLVYFYTQYYKHKYDVRIGIEHLLAIGFSLSPSPSLSLPFACELRMFFLGLPWRCSG